MALATPLSQANPSTMAGNNHLPGMRTNGIVMPEMDSLVAPQKARPVPNHLLDTQMFHKVSHNSVVQAEPSAVHFTGFEPGKVHKQILRLINISSECQNMHIIPPSTRYFKAWYAKRDRLVPGMAVEVEVEFRPDEWRYYYDCIRIHCQDEENLLVPVHAYPAMSTAEFPEVIKFPPVSISESRTRVIPLRCDAPVDFEFQLTFLQPHPAFTVEPMSGIVPGNSEVNITVTFAPTEFSTALMKLQLVTSQFNSKPLVCLVSGSSAPGLAEAEMAARCNGHASRPSDSLLDPHSISPVAMARRKKRTKSRNRTSSRDALATSKEIERDGVRFPSNLDTQHSVNTVLMQQAGKLRAKELREAVLAKQDAVPNTRQLKEALFDHEVKQDVLSERRNQLRWQVHLGRDQITATAREEILQSRKEAVKEYHFQRGDPLPDIEFNRSCTTCTQRRTHRTVESIPPPVAMFDPYTNDPWAMKHRALGHFQQAAMRVIIQLRVEGKRKMIRKLIEDYRTGRAGREQSATYGEDQDSQIKDIPLVIDAEKVQPYAFPTYTAPDFKDDMAPDALGIVPAKSSEVFVKRKVPFFNLKVPQQYRLMSYVPHNIQDASSGYVPPRLIRPLRTGAEDEIINVPAPEPAWTKEQAISDVGVSPEETIELALRETGPVELTPPSALFRPIDYPPLHIFNPAPGLQVFMPPLPYAEVDADFHLCPLPRYTHKDPSNKHGTTLKKFLDREDVIRSTMQWKKFPSQGLVSLSNTPTLTNVWVPRWTDPFSTDLLPGDVPSLLDGLPVEDKPNVIDQSDDEADAEEKPEAVSLAPGMVNAEFPLVQHTQAPDRKDSDEFPYGSKLPAHNNPVSSTGPVPREKREAELEVFLQKRYNRLGDKVESRVTHMNNLATQPDLVLK
ncbi:cilia- and flagella-associated protein 221-like [Patiria miniata]|uniref:Primary ciliary dyskinesia protein 1 n=1 Tax=Patiria miniata TaxID=46514 RepID=A0A913YZ13_PATMI|nr:cilia- and flagella-associated protein 221-like [Patiria miniata]